MSLGLQDTTALLDHVHIWLSFCTISSFSWHLQMAQRIVFTESGFWKYSWAHLVMSMTESCRWVMQFHLRVRRPQVSNKGLRPCPLRFSKSFDDVMHCRWWDLQSLWNLMLMNIVFKVFHNLVTHSFTNWRASVHLNFSKILELIMLQTWCQFTSLVARCSPSWIFSKCLAFSALCCPHANLWDLWQASNLKWAHFVEKSVTFHNLNMRYVIYVLFWIKYWLMWFESLLVFTSGI